MQLSLGAPGAPTQSHCPIWPCLPSSPLALRELLWAQEPLHVGQGSPAPHATELADSRALSRDQN